MISRKNGEIQGTDKSHPQIGGWQGPDSPKPAPKKDKPKADKKK